MQRFYIVFSFTLFLLVNSCYAQISVQELLKRGDIRKLNLSPNADLIMYADDEDIMIGNKLLGYHKVFSNGRAYYLGDIDWVGNDAVKIRQIGKESHPSRTVFIKINAKDGSVTKAQQNIFEKYGDVFDPIPEDNNSVLFEAYEVDDGSYYSNVYRINIFASETGQFKNHLRLNKTSSVQHWLTNDKHELVLGFSNVDGRFTIWRQKERAETWEDIWHYDGVDDFTALRLSKDKKTLWTLNNIGRDKTALIEFNLETLQFGDVIKQNNRFDIDHVIFSRKSGRPLAVSYMEHGLRRYDNITEGDTLVSKLQAQFPGDTIALASSSLDEQHVIIWTLSSTNPGQPYLCNQADCELIGDAFPWLEGEDFAKTRHLPVKAEDGFMIDSFLTLPLDHTSNIPLVVVPHGGPIGVSDSRYFSGETQWLTRNGFAVLQVNYRGSTGYGKAFMQAGMQQWGRAIEADIKLARENALKQAPQLNADKICIYGASYGGYSALMSTAIEPDVYKCAASFAGVTDLNLIFNRSQISRNHELEDLLKQIVGDPTKEQESLQQYSPVYQYKDLNVPLFIAHGDEDDIVDVEHSWRLKKMLDLRGVSYKWQILKGVGHGFEYVGQADKFYRKLVPFLKRHLK